MPTLLHALGVFCCQLYRLSEPSSPQYETLLSNIKKVLSKIGQVLQLEPPTHPLEYCPIYHTDVFDAIITFVKKGQGLPLHNHPNMTVFTQVIHGELSVTTYDIKESHIHNDRKVHKVAGETRTVTASSDCLVIRPNNGPNIHSFTALSDYVIFVDVIGPPYNDEERPCTYYKQVDPASIGQTLGEWLMEDASQDVDFHLQIYEHLPLMCPPPALLPEIAILKK